MQLFSLSIIWNIVSNSRPRGVIYGGGGGGALKVEDLNRAAEAASRERVWDRGLTPLSFFTDRLRYVHVSLRAACVNLLLNDY